MTLPLSGIMVTVEQVRTASIEDEFLRRVIDAGCTLEHVERGPKGNLIAIVIAPPRPLRHITINQTVGAP